MQAAAWARLAVSARWSGVSGVDGIGVACDDDGEAGGCESGAQACCEGEGHILFENVVAERGAGVRAAMCGIEEDEAAVDGWGGGRLGAGRIWDLRRRGSG